MVDYIQRYYESEPFPIPYVKSLAEVLFRPFLRRFLAYLRDRHFKLRQKQGHFNANLFDKILECDDIDVFIGQCQAQRGMSLNHTRKWFTVRGVCRVHFPTGIICIYAGSNTYRGHIFMDSFDDVIVDGKYNIDVKSDVKRTKQERQANAKFLDWVK